MCHDPYPYRLLDYDTLERATNGNPEAIKTVLHFYGPYMRSLAVVIRYNQNGDVSFIPDAHKFEDLKIQAITSTLKFKIR